MNKPLVPMSITVLDKEYRVACRDDERQDLLISVELLNRKMLEIRDSGKVVGIERIAVMTALNLANELLQCQTYSKRQTETIRDHVGSLLTKLESALTGVRQINL